MYGVSASLFILYGAFGFLSLSIRRLQEEYLYSFDHTESKIEPLTEKDTDL